MSQPQQDREKQLAAEAAAELVEPDTVVGLGTGSTAAHAIRHLGRRVREGLAIRAMPTSAQTAALARAEGIPLIDFTHITHLDLTIDGADEVDPALNLIKGGGGALFREKIVAAASRRVVIIADASKRVERLGRFPLPVEVNPFGWQVVAEKVRALGATVTLRQVDAEAPFTTENGGYILDCAFGLIERPEELELRLQAIVGVVETGLFVGIAERVLVGNGDRVEAFIPRR